MPVPVSESESETILVPEEATEETDSETDLLENAPVPDPKPVQEPAETTASRIRVQEQEMEMSPAAKIEKRRIQPRKLPRVKRRRIVRVSPLARYIRTDNFVDLRKLC